MLNTSLHNPRIKSKDRMTSPQFVNMCKHVDGSHYTIVNLQEVCVCVMCVCDVCVCVCGVCVWCVCDVCDVCVCDMRVVLRACVILICKLCDV